MNIKTGKLTPCGRELGLKLAQTLFGYVDTSILLVSLEMCTLESFQSTWKLIVAVLLRLLNNATSGQLPWLRGGKKPETKFPDRHRGFFRGLQKLWLDSPHSTASGTRTINPPLLSSHYLIDFRCSAENEVNDQQGGVLNVLLESFIHV